MCNRRWYHQTVCHCRRPFQFKVCSKSCMLVIQARIAYIPFSLGDKKNLTYAVIFHTITLRHATNTVMSGPALVSAALAMQGISSLFRELHVALLKFRSNKRFAGDSGSLTCDQQIHSLRLCFLSYMRMTGLQFLETHPLCSHVTTLTERTSRPSRTPRFKPSIARRTFGVTTLLVLLKSYPEFCLEFFSALWPLRGLCIATRLQVFKSSSDFENGFHWENKCRIRGWQTYTQTWKTSACNVSKQRTRLQRKSPNQAQQAPARGQNKESTSPSQPTAGKEKTRVQKEQLQPTKKVAGAETKASEVKMKTSRLQTSNQRQKKIHKNKERRSKKRLQHTVGSKNKSCSSRRIEDRKNEGKHPWTASQKKTAGPKKRAPCSFVFCLLHAPSKKWLK